MKNILEIINKMCHNVNRHVGFIPTSLRFLNVFHLCGMMNTRKFLAFTLAEIIFVMGIIGIVATLTITNARKDTDVAEKVAQLRKTDEILSTAFAQAVAENGSIDHWGTNGGDPTVAQVWEVVSPYLKLKKKCDTSTGCWKTGNVKYLNDSNDSINIEGNSDIQKGILVNGVSVAIGNNFDWSGSPFIGYIYVDVNGPKNGTYRYGDDVLAFVVDKESGEVLPNGSNYPDSHFSGDCLDNGSYCTAWVMQFGNQDYLKSCRNELSWDGKHNCR